MTTTATDRTLVLGATGKTGRRIVPRLRMRGVPVRPASRSGPTRFDWSDPAGWDAVLRGVGTVYVVAPTVPGPVHGFVDRAEAAGVRRLVLLSGRAADDWGDTTFGRDMLSAEDAVRSSALEWTVLRPSNFAQNFDEDVFHAPLLAGSLALPAGPVPEPFVDLEDVADVAAAVLTEPGRHAGLVHELTGPRAVRFAEAVDLIAGASGRPISYRQVSPDAYTASPVARGAPRAGGARSPGLSYLRHRGAAAATTDGVATVLGRAPRPFEDYVVRAAAAGAWRGRPTGGTR